MQQRANITDTLYAAGARHFLFQNIPPIDRTPQVIGYGTYGAASNAEWVSAYNSALTQFNANFKKEHPDVSVEQKNPIYTTPLSILQHVLILAMGSIIHDF